MDNEIRSLIFSFELKLYMLAILFPDLPLDRMFGFSLK